MKSIKRFLQFHDWVWSIILGFMAYWLLNWGPSQIGNVAMTYYAVNFVQPLLATGAVMAALMFMTRLGLYFYFRDLHRFIWGEKAGSSRRSLFEFINQLTSWQRFLIVFFSVAGLFGAALLVFLKFLSLAGSAPLS